MISCVCMNPAMDKTIELDGFNYGGMNRVKRAVYDASGKAVNVAIVLARLGDAVRLVGLNYNEGGRKVEDKLSAEGVSSKFIWLDGALRVNIKALDTRTGKITEINDAGAPVAQTALSAAAGLIAENSASADFTVLTGSLPVGADAGFYRDIMERSQDSARFILDCDGAGLNEGIKARPFLIKPNRAELEMLCGRRLHDRYEIKAQAQQICRAGVSWTAVSMGPDGAVMASASEAFFAPALDVGVRSTVGAGDSMVAGLIHGFMLDGGADTALRWGSACGNASVMTEGTKLIDASALPELLKRTSIERL